MMGFPDLVIEEADGISLAGFAAACNSEPTCAGFDSYGVLRYALRPIDEWDQWTTNPCLGFYTRDKS